MQNKNITETIRIAVIGLGYVGLPLARLFSTRFRTVGYDINKNRVDALKAGHDATLEVDDGDYFRTYGMYRSSLVDSWYNNKKEEWGNFAVRNGSEDSLYYAIGRMRTPTKIFMFADTMCTAEST